MAGDGVIPAKPTIKTLGSGFAKPDYAFKLGVAVDANGDVFVADGSYGGVREILEVNGSILIGLGISEPGEMLVFDQI